MQTLNSKWQVWRDRPLFHYLLLAAITLLALALRFYKLGDWSFWIDEIRTINRAQAHYSTLKSVIQNIPPATNWVPISTILTAGSINYFGLSEWSARLVPALIGAISVPVFFFPVKRLLGPIVALITVLLLAIAPWHIDWSQNARFITSLMLFYSLALFAIFFALERDRLWYFLLFIGLLYLATSERLYSLLIVPVIISYLFLLIILKFERPPGFRIKNLLILLIPGAIFIVIEAYNVIANGTSRFFADFGGFLGTPIESPLGMALFIFSEIGIPLGAFAFFTGIYLVLQKNRTGLFIWLGAVIPVLLLILATPFMFTEERYVFVTLPCWLILGAIGVKEIFNQTKGNAKFMALGILVIFLADAVGQDQLFYRVNNGNRRDWRGAFALVEEESREGDVFVSTWPELGDYYMDEEFVSWQDTNRDDVIARNSRVWFVVIPDVARFWGSESFYRWVKNNAELIDVTYLRRRDDANLYTYLYDPSQVLDDQ